MLICVWTFALITAILAVLVILKKPVLNKLEEEMKIALDLQLISGMAIGGVQLLKICAFICCKECINFGVLILGVIVEFLLSFIAGVVMAFLKAP